MVNDLIREALATRGHGAQTELARALGVRVQTVNKWKDDQTTPLPERWPAIEAALDLEPGTIAAKVGTPPPTADQVTLLERRLDRMETLLHQVAAELREIRGA